MPGLYRAADLLVVPSRYESFGLATLEALSCGTPVVAAGVGAADDLIRPGCNGRLLPAPSPEGLAGAILKQLGAGSRDPEDVRAIVAGWTWERSAAMKDAVLRDLKT